jgi:hypothetical protein
MPHYKVSFTHQNAGPNGKDIEVSGQAYHFADTKAEVMAVAKNNIKAGLAKEYRKTVKVKATQVDLESEQDNGPSET